MLCKICYLI
jgi:kelch-like protein 20